MTILADRGFGDHKLFAYLADLGFAYVICFHGNIHVTDALARRGLRRNGSEQIRPGAQAARSLRSPRRMPIRSARWYVCHAWT